MLVYDDPVCYVLWACCSCTSDNNGDSVLMDIDCRVTFSTLLEALHAGLPHPPQAVVVAGCGTSHWMPGIAEELGASFGIAPSAHSSITELVLRAPLFVRFRVFVSLVVFRFVVAIF